eukprot:TRINITY_DN357_c0_g1_i2.p1 TRINITY_DN357_c0_g1~~TRINITY_DN357_c0_g1_i2.p1  ORF type:complete len:389 (-),score=86.06 TRINITY_DN357_c0_g1_i2:39-1205(-)
MRLVDPRQQRTVAAVEAHAGTKGARAIFLGRKNRIATLGFSKQSERQLSIWDPRRLDTALSSQSLGMSAGMMMPFYDDDTAMLYLAGKGDGNVRYFEMIDENPFVYSLSEHKDSVPQRGMAMLPKRCVDVSKCEMARLYKLTGPTIQPISFVAPRKGDGFHADIYPDTIVNWEPTVRAADWFAGANNPPRLASMSSSSIRAPSAAAAWNPVQQPAGGSSYSPAPAAASRSFAPPQSTGYSQPRGGGRSLADLEAENRQLRSRLAQLQDEYARRSAEKQRQQQYQQQQYQQQQYQQQQYQQQQYQQQHYQAPAPAPAPAPRVSYRDLAGADFARELARYSIDQPVLDVITRRNVPAARLMGASAEDLIEVFGQDSGMRVFHALQDMARR